MGWRSFVHFVDDQERGEPAKSILWCWGGGFFSWRLCLLLSRLCMYLIQTFLNLLHYVLIIILKTCYFIQKYYIGFLIWKILQMLQRSYCCCTHCSFREAKEQLCYWTLIYVQHIITTLTNDFMPGMSDRVHIDIRSRITFAVNQGLVHSYPFLL